MTTCANCSAPATLVYNISNVQNIFYCGKHAPRSVQSLLLPLATEAETEAVAIEVAKTTKKSKTSTVINSAPVEEGVNSNSENTEEEVTIDGPVD